MENQSNPNEDVIVAGAHLSSLLKYFLPPFHLIVLLAIWVIYSDKSDRIEINTRKALNFQITILIITAAVALLAGIVIGGSLLAGGIDLWQRLDDVGDFPFAAHSGVFTTILVTVIVAGVTTLALGIVDIVYSLRNALMGKNGESFHYPISFNIISPPKSKTQAAL